MRTAGALLSAALLCGCGSPPALATDRPAPHAAVRAPLVAPSAHEYVDRAWGFRIEVPAGWKLHHAFPTNYLANGAWKTYAAPDSRGVAIIALTLPGSNHITDAEIRIGASRNARAIRDCMRPPSAVQPGSTRRVRVNGTAFTTFDASDAAMSHWLDVRAYRAVHDGACYAIDLLVHGTNPEVYTPPATPPFSRAEALPQMRVVLQSLRFTR